MRLWRFYFRDGRIQFLGACHTYDLWPVYEKRERDNW
jgi:hypothetical protein